MTDMVTDREQYEADEQAERMTAYELEHAADTEDIPTLTLEEKVDAILADMATVKAMGAQVVEQAKPLIDAISNNPLIGKMLGL